jgi:hypothetical protein
LLLLLLLLLRLLLPLLLLLLLLLVGRSVTCGPLWWAAAAPVSGVTCCPCRARLLPQQGGNHTCAYRHTYIAAAQQQ